MLRVAVLQSITLSVTQERVPYYRKALKKALNERIERNPRYSLRAFASALQTQPSALSQILAGKRLLSEKLANRFFQVLDLPPEEQSRFLVSIAETKKDLGIGRMSPTLKRVLNRRPEPEIQDLSGEAFRFIAEWYHAAILELTRVKGFQADPVWIASQLKIPVLQAQLAFERLKELELIEEQEGRWVKSEQWLDTLDKSVTSSAHKKRQREVLEKSIDSLENDPIEERNHSSLTVPIDPEKIPYAKKKIQKFMWDLANELSHDKKERVYEFTVNLFPLQVKPKSKGEK